jgi:hypothetical protein
MLKFCFGHVLRKIRLYHNFKVKSQDLLLLKLQTNVKALTCQNCQTKDLKHLHSQDLAAIN